MRKNPTEKSETSKKQPNKINGRRICKGQTVMKTFFGVHFKLRQLLLKWRVARIVTFYTIKSSHRFVTKIKLQQELHETTCFVYSFYFKLSGVLSLKKLSVAISNNDNYRKRVFLKPNYNEAYRRTQEQCQRMGRNYFRTTIFIKAEV